MKLFLERVSFVLALIMIMMGSTFAKKLTLNDCIDLALKNRASIIRAQGSEQLAKATQRSALGAFLPNLSASYNYSKGRETSISPPIPFAYEPSIDTFVVNGDTAKDFNPKPTGSTDSQDKGPSKSLTFSSGISIFNLPNIFSYIQAKAEREAAHLDVINSEQDLIYAVKTAYYAFLATNENVDVQNDAVTRSEEQLKLIQSKYDLGSAALSDVLKQKVLFGNDKLSLLKAKNAVVTARAGLAYTIGVDPSKDYEFSTEYTTHEFEGTIDDAMNFGLKHEPGFLSAQKNYQASKSGVRSSFTQYLPQISAFLNYNVFKGTQAFPKVFNYSSNTVTYGFRVSLNIFDGFFREKQLSSAKINRNNALASVSETKNLLIRDIKTAYYNIEQQKEAKNVANENVKAAQEDLNITKEKYNLGSATILDLLNAQVSLKQAQVSFIQADFDLNLAIAQLENAMGKM